MSLFFHRKDRDPINTLLYFKVNVLFLSFIQYKFDLTQYRVNKQEGEMQ